MKNLEYLLNQEPRETNFEEYLIFYSVSVKPIEVSAPETSSLEFISDYADSLNQQYGVPSPIVKPRTPSSSVNVENFNSEDLRKSWNNFYKPYLSEGELAYADSLNKQSNVTSSVIKPATSSFVTAKSFDSNQVIEAIKNPICPSLSNKPLTVSSSPVKNSSKNFVFLRALKPEEQFYNKFKEEHKIRLSGLKNTNPVHKLFKKNDLPKLYNQFSEGLNLKKDSVKIITFTNPLKNMNDFSPSFTLFNKELRLPAIKPKEFPFNTVSQEEYNKMLKNAFLPHELGHAKIEEQYGKSYRDINGAELQGFSEHLADAFAFDSVKNTSQLLNTKTERIKFEDKWAKPMGNFLFPSRAEQNYTEVINFKRDATFVPGKQATIEVLGDNTLKERYDSTLKNVLNFKYGDDTHKYSVYGNVNKLSQVYQDQSIKLINLSKRDSFLSNFKTKKILYDVQKESWKFMDNL